MSSLKNKTENYCALYIDYKFYSSKVEQLKINALIGMISDLYQIASTNSNYEKILNHFKLSLEFHLDVVRNSTQSDEYKAISICKLIQQSTNVRSRKDLILIEEEHLALIESLGNPLKMMVLHYFFLFSRLGRFKDAENYGKKIFATHYSRGQEGHEQLFGLLHYAFGHQTLSSDLMYKKNKYEGTKFKILTSEEYVANGYLNKINKMIFEESPEKFEDAIVRNQFSMLDCCGIINNNFSWHPPVISRINFELAKTGNLVSVYNEYFSHNITEIAESECLNFLKKRKYVTIYSRQPNFKGEPKWRYHYNTYRQSNPNLLKKSILYLISIGYSVIRMGDPVKCNLGINSPYYWDYAGSDSKSDVNDVLIFKDAEFSITNGLGGGYYLPYCFDIPNLLVNFPFTHKPIWHPYVRVAIKPMKKFGIFTLKLADYFNNGLNMLEDGYKMREDFVIPFNLTGGEVLEVLKKFEIKQRDRKKMFSDAVDQALWCAQYGHEDPVALII